ncbi:hypothetical protein PF003_g4598 [Phytophthora fragariae]|nr:hypothetical protein PF003_g4598 [Phytophthora fragariae]
MGPKTSTTRSIKNLAIDLAVCSGTDAATAYLVVYSTAAITYRLPFIVTGNGPATSMTHLSPTSPVRTLLSGDITDITASGAALRLPQSWHADTQSRTLICMYGHQYSLCSRS